MAKLDYRNIEKDAQRCGGQPVVVGTRVRVATILTCYRQGLLVEEIVQQFPTLRPADVHDALAYAYDHLDEIEADCRTLQPTWKPRSKLDVFEPIRTHVHVGRKRRQRRGTLATAAVGKVQRDA